MSKIKTREELLIEYRNQIALRQLSYEASAIYFKNRSKKCKTNSQEAVDAVNNFSTNDHNAKLDRDFLKNIDLMIEESIKI